MEFIIFITCIGLIIATISAHGKISRLEAKIEALLTNQPNPATSAQTKRTPVPVSSQHTQNNHPTDAAIDSVSVPTPIPLAQQTSVTAFPSASPATDTTPEPLFLTRWFAENTLIKIGSVIFFLGAAWFVTYAFDQNWISPLARVMLGLLLALVVYSIGVLRVRSDQTQYVSLTALGSGVVFVSVLAAQFSFAEPLLPGFISLIILVISIAYTVWAAVRTNTEWLAIAAAIAALFAPEFSGTDVDSVIPLFVYLLTVSAGLCGVVLFTSWRYVTLVLLGGVSMFALWASDVPSQATVTWFFVILFSILFLSITTVSIIRNRIPLLIDGFTLLTAGLLYAYFVHSFAVVPALAMFAAAAVCAVVGYAARMRDVDPSAVLLYAVCSIVGIFAGTAYLFDGVTATFFFAIESAAVIYLAMRFAFLEKTIYLASATLIIPFILGLVSLASNDWNDGLLHPALLAVVSVSAVLGSVGLYMYLTAERASLSWLQGIANTVLGGWYVFTVITSIVIADTIATLTGTMTSMWTTLLLLGFSLLLTALALVRTHRESARSTVLWSYALPILFAMGTIIQSADDGTFTLAVSFVLLLMLVAIIGLVLVFAKLALVEKHRSDITAWYTLLWIGVLYASFWFMAYMGTIFSSEITVTVSAIAFSTLCYGVVNSLLKMDVSFGKVTPFIWALIVPTVALLPAYNYDSWGGNVLSIDAVSLYVHITILALLARTMFVLNSRHTVKSKDTVRMFATALVVGASVMSFMLVWVLSHVLAVSSVVAVSIALFVYTFTGLGLYVYGKRADQDMYTRAGYLLLGAVVLRLGLIDVWGMELFWRIITFLGIGTLFIIGALFEKVGSDPQSAKEPNLPNEQ